MRRTACAVALLVICAGPAAAAETAGGSIDGTQIKVDVTYTGAGSNVDVDLNRDGGAHPLLTFQFEADPDFLPIDADGICRTPADEPGYRYLRIATDGAGHVVDTTHVCLATSSPTAPAPSAAFPQPPTMEEAWNAAHLPPPTISTDPPGRGVTGLDTRIAATSPNAVTIAASVRGYTITGTAVLVQQTVSIDAGPPTTGSHAHFVFETRGTHTLTTKVTYRGTAILTGPGITNAVTIDLGTATITARRAYRVREVRSILQP